MADVDLTEVPAAPKLGGKQLAREWEDYVRDPTKPTNPKGTCKHCGEIVNGKVLTKLTSHILRTCRRVPPERKSYYLELEQVRAAGKSSAAEEGAHTGTKRKKAATEAETRAVEAFLGLRPDRAHVLSMMAATPENAADAYDPRKLSQEEREKGYDYPLGDFVLTSGITLRNAKLHYRTWGNLAEDKGNAILYPTWYSGKHWDNDWLIGPAFGLDPRKYFIIVPNMLGNGLSSSPSNTPPPFDQARFPQVTIQDNVAAQHLLLTEGFGITTLVLVVGWAMGAAQTYQWAVSHPEMVQRILPFCGAARTSEHNKVMLEGLKATLAADVKFAGGWYRPEDPPLAGLRAFARVYAGWGFSQQFYWRKEWRKLGYASLEDFLVGFWEGFWLDRRDPNNLILMLNTWQSANVGLTAGLYGEHEKALRSIKAEAVVVPAANDLYFPPEDHVYEASFLPHAELRVIPGVWGHFAGGGQNAEDTIFIDQAVRDLLARPSRYKAVPGV